MSHSQVLCVGRHVNTTSWAHIFRHFRTQSFPLLVTGVHLGREKSSSMTVADTKRAAPLGITGLLSSTSVSGASG